MDKLLKFKGTWRDYQKRILDNLLLHLSDDKIHVVAAPGAGKTTLGIEIISKINKPTIIFAPTITIRNQWKERIIDAFLTDKNADIISLNIREPKLITIITYQSLLASFCGKEEDDDEDNLIEEETEENICNRFNKEKSTEIINSIKSAGIKVLCFDEAHHLRNEWWKALNYLMEAIKFEQTLSLTATPPYDADLNEWERYSSLCGEMDETISIPELVQNGDLCPHQDFIHFSLLRKNESEEIAKQIVKIAEFLNELYTDEDLTKLLLDYISNEKEDVILDEPKTYISIASFLKKANKTLPNEFLELFGLKQNEIPSFTTEYQKLFLSFLLIKNKDYFSKINEELISSILNKAKQNKIFYKKTIYLNDNPSIKRQIANSLGKLDSIKDIVNLEVQALQKNLRMVILADYIKYDVLDCSQLGVIPIWQTLKDRKDISLCVLTGSITLLPKAIENDFINKINKLNLSEFFTIKPFDRDENYIKINAKGKKRALLVNLITEMFNEGFITIMVGTQALLGEGWDAPCINSLILSSTVSSYMLSNQMRGRAIRKDKNNPDKISNIWHLASIKILNETERIQQLMPSAIKEEKEDIIQLFDFVQLDDRFKGFEAPAIEEPYYIENGIERILSTQTINRLYLSNNLPSENDYLDINTYMKENAIDRNKTKELWEKGFIKKFNAPAMKLRKGVESEVKFKTFTYTANYLNFISFYFTIFLIACSGILALPNEVKALALLFFALIFIIAIIPPSIKVLKCSTPEKLIREICVIIIETLYSMDKIKTNLQKIRVVCERNQNNGTIFCAVENVSTEENNLIINSLIEFLDPIENPRYIFVRNSKLLGFKNTTDYHAIPYVIGQKKDYVELFQMLWNKYIGECDIIYTRTKEGRKTLISARKEAFSDLVRNKKSKKLSKYE